MNDQTEKSKSARHIVIVGGGIAGLALATKLGKKLGRSGKANITLVDRNTSHVWKPMLHTFAAGTSHPYQQKIPFVSHAARNGFRYIPGCLLNVNRGESTITLSRMMSDDNEVILEERCMSYDTLILAAGSRANDFGTPGVAESCLFIDDLREAENFNRRLYNEMLRAAVYGDKLKVAIVGGGATGVELAAEISQLLEIAEGYDEALRPDLELTLLESGPRILPAFPENISTLATEQLHRLGMSVRTGTRVIAADNEGFVLEGGSRIDAPLRVWAAGVKATSAFAALKGFDQTGAGQIIIKPTLQTTTDDNIFAIGDCASLVPPNSTAALPATAQVARQQAIYLAKHLPAWLEGTPLPPFVFRDFGTLVSLGRYNAFGTLGRRGFLKGGFIRGHFAQFSHAMLYRLHQVELHGLARASMLWLSGIIASIVRPSIRLD